MEKALFKGERRLFIYRRSEPLHLRDQSRGTPRAIVLRGTEIPSPSAIKVGIVVRFPGTRWRGMMAGFLMAGGHPNHPDNAAIKLGKIRLRAGTQRTLVSLP